jgi:hypothetical protein
VVQRIGVENSGDLRYLASQAKGLSGAEHGNERVNQGGNAPVCNMPFQHIKKNGVIDIVKEPGEVHQQGIAFVLVVIYKV